MPLTISDDVLRELGMSEAEARVEIACRLFDAEKLHLPAASRLAGLSRVEMEAELMKRKIPVYRPTVEDLHQDLKALEGMDRREGERADRR